MESSFENGVNRRGTACIKWDFQQLDYEGKTGLLPFSIADADYPTCQPVLDALKARIDKGVIGYTDLNEEYYAPVKNWIRRRHDWEIQRSWIVPVGGIVPAMCNAIEALTAPGDAVIVQPPVYDPFYSIVRASGRKMVCNDLIHDESGYHMDYPGLEKICREGAKALLLCSPHNPVCRVWTREELQKLADIAAEYHLLVISDEIHWDLMLYGNRHVTMGLFPEIADHLIVCTSCSKTFNIAGLETSNLIIPNDELRKKLQNYLFDRYEFVPNTLGLEAVKSAYTHGEAWVDEELRFLTENADLARSYLAEHLPQVKLADPQGTYLLWMDMTAYGKTSRELIRAIAEEGAGLNSGKEYGDHYDGFVRMNIACPKKQLRAGLECIRRALDRLS